VQHDDEEPNADDAEFASGGAMPFAFYHMINAHPSDEEYFDTSVPDHSLGVQLSFGAHVPLWIRNSTPAQSARAETRDVARLCLVAASVVSPVHLRCTGNVVRRWD